jgi:hypothetical protein
MSNIGIGPPDFKPQELKLISLFPPPSSLASFATKINLQEWETKSRAGRSLRRTWRKKNYNISDHLENVPTQPRSGCAINQKKKTDIPPEHIRASIFLVQYLLMGRKMVIIYKLWWALTTTLRVHCPKRFREFLYQQLRRWAPVFSDESFRYG